jgi:hypothetical protein
MLFVDECHLLWGDTRGYCQKYSQRLTSLSFSESFMQDLNAWQIRHFYLIIPTKVTSELLEKEECKAKIMQIIIA